MSGVDVVVDRLTRGSEAIGRRLDSIETAFARGLGRARILIEPDGPDSTFDRKRRCSGCGQVFADPDPRLFRSNSPLGACSGCEGYGTVVDLEADPGSSPTHPGRFDEGAIAPLEHAELRKIICSISSASPNLPGLPVDRPFADLTPRPGRLGL